MKSIKKRFKKMRREDWEGTLKKQFFDAVRGAVSANK
ncbi:MAG: hypothetical protein ACI935_000034 [Moritella dasanensis]|jgi:hypothetical protein